MAKKGRLVAQQVVVPKKLNQTESLAFMADQELKPIAILGAGSWGTALAIYLARRGQSVRLWSIEPAEIAAMLTEKINNQYLPGYDLPETIQPSARLSEAVEGIEDIIVVVPSIGFKATIRLLKPLLKSTMRITCATKGLDADTGQLPNEMVADILGKERQFAVLSGPSFAREVAAGLPTAVVIASQNQKLVADLKQRFDSAIFQVYPSNDVVGVEIGGIVKNVIAIATGIADGMGFGANTRSALITYGLAEIILLGEAMGGQLKTFIGLSGIGDLMLTCSDNQSRNRRLGLAIGKGQSIKEVEREVGQVMEGKRNAELVNKLAQRYKIRMPICETVAEILQGDLKPELAIERMLATQEKLP